MSIAIIGARGNMGRRYSAICTYLGIEFGGFDLHNEDDFWNDPDRYDSALLCTPSDTHMEILESLAVLEMPVLCEKPMVKTKEELDRLLSWHMPLRMVNQYEYLYDSASDGESYYDYWNSGKDGVWDFINIIGLSQKPPIIRNVSPLWKCQINGTLLNIRDMDHAYCDMIWNWHKNPRPNPEYIEKAHRRVLEGFYVT